MHIQDTRAVVSGGASGLGEAVAECIVEAGGRVALLDVNAATGPALAARLGERASFIETDVTSEAGVNAAVAGAVQAMGGLNLAVNCAGVGWPKRLVGKDGPMPGDFFRKVIEINLVGTLLVCKAAGEALAARLGDHATFIETDVTSESAVNAAVAAAAAAMGGLNVAVKMCELLRLFFWVSFRLRSLIFRHYQTFSLYNCVSYYLQPALLQSFYHHTSWNPNC